MKKISKYLGLLTAIAAIAAFNSCESSKTKETAYTDLYTIEKSEEKSLVIEHQTADEVDTESDEVEAVEVAEATETSLADEADVYEDDVYEDAYDEEDQSDKKKKSRFAGTFTYGNKNEFTVTEDTIKVITKDITGISEKTASIYIRNDNGWKGFGCNNSVTFYIIQFDSASIHQLQNYAQTYFSDFENKKLIRNKKSTVRAYGKLYYQLNWGTLSNSTPNNAKGNGVCGYEFVKGNPYFTISNNQFLNDYYEVAGDSTDRESKALKYYFTRAQLKKLIEVLSE